MPRKSHRSQQATAQRTSGKRGFDSGFFENPFAKLLDPDFKPEHTESVPEMTDSEDEDGDHNQAFSLTLPEEENKRIKIEKMFSTYILITTPCQEDPMSGRYLP